MIPEDNNHIAAYLEGTLLEEQQTVFEEKLASSPEFRKEVNDYRFIWEQSRLLKKQSEFHTHENWDKLQRRINRTPFKYRLWNGIRTAAAVLLLPLIISILYLLAVKQDHLTTNEIAEVTSAPGIVSKLILPDSTQVWLNSGSTLVYPRQFNSITREVQLTGEAYFKVKSDKEHRFDVKTSSGMTVSAYGTEFNICAYEKDETIEAVLVKGHIEVQVGNISPQKLNESQKAKLSKKNNLFQISNCNILEATAWKDGKLVFHKANILDITKKLSRRFDADFIINGRSPADYEFSATFTNESLSDILSILEKTASMEFRIEEPIEKDDKTYSSKKVILILK